MMLKYFRRRKPAHDVAPVPDRGDMLTAYFWGLSLDQWEGLTDFERAECRRNVTTAPRFVS